MLAANVTSKPVLSFNLAATNACFSKGVAQRLTVRVDRTELGWEVGVFKHNHGEDLLYPDGNWHGAQPWQLSAWMHRSQIYPDDRALPVRGTTRAVRVRFSGARVAGKPGHERFVAGKADVYLDPS